MFTTIKSTKVTRLLLGKHKPTFHPSRDMGDHVVVINSKYVSLTGKNWSEKVYYRHSGYLGNLRVEKAQFLNLRKPTEVSKKE